MTTSVPLHSYFIVSHQRLDYIIISFMICQQLFSYFFTFEKSSNKCKTLLAKHHFIILHNYVCVLLANLHSLPLFSFCSLLILLYLCQSCQFFLEQFAGGFPSEHLPWVVVDPVLYPLDIVLCPVIEVLSLWYLPAHQSVLVFVAATLKGAVWVAVEHGHSLFGLICCRLLHSLPVSELRAIVHGYGLEHLPESLSPFRF